jgi:SAM-dependent methyltransferase
MKTEVQYLGRELEAMSFADNYHRWILEEFHPHLGQTIVEVGAGVGDFSKMLLDCHPLHLYSFEPADNLFPRLQRALAGIENVTPVKGFLDPLAAPEMADSVLYVNVLEHIEDDVGELRRARRVLKPGGNLLVFVPALSWLYSPADRRMGHYRRYHKKGLAHLVESAGFKITHLRYFDMAGVIPWFVYFRLFRGTLGNHSVTAYDRLVVPVMRRVERWLIPPLGKNLLLVARYAE